MWLSEWCEWVSEWVQEWFQRMSQWFKMSESRKSKWVSVNEYEHSVPRLPRKSHAAVHIVPRLPRKRGGDPRDARAYIRPLGSAHCPTPATQKRRRPKGRQGVHPTPWQCTLSHACHAKEAETQGTPGRTSDPLAAHIVPRLPRKSGGDPRDARAYIRPLGSAHCATPATQKRRRPKGRQGVHPTPWQCTLCHACHAKEAETQGTPGRTSDPLAVHIVPRLPRKRGGDPRDARAYIRPLGCSHCDTPATQKRRRPKGRQGVHPTPWQCTLCHACHAKEAETQGTPGRTSDPLAVHIVPRLPRKRGGDPRDARAYIRPLGSAHCATPATQKRRRPKGRQGVHPTPWLLTLCHACHAKAAETQGTPGRTSDPLAVHIVPRLPRKRGGDPRDARGVHPTPWQCTLCHACHAKEAETQGTPGRTSDPLAVHIVPRLPRKRGGDPRDARAYIRPLGSAHCATPATQKRRRPKGRQGVHPTPWQCTLCHACHAKEAETQGTPGRTSDPLAVHIVPRMPPKRGGDPRDARAYIRPLGSAHCATRVSECVSEWVSEWLSEWVSDWVSECVSVWVSECEWGTGGASEWVSEWVIEWVSEWVCEWVEWVSVWVSECVSEWVSECVSEWVCVCVSECVSEWVSEWVCEWVSVSEWVSVCEVGVVRWVSECEWVSVSVCVCEWGSAGEWVSECVWVSVWVSVSEWVFVSEWVSECDCVCEWGGGRAGGGRTGGGGGYRTKTKTPHVNVGKKTNSKLKMGWSDFRNDQPSLWESMTHDFLKLSRKEPVEKRSRS